MSYSSPVSGHLLPPNDPAFTSEAIERASRYHRPRYIALLADTVISLGVLAAAAMWVHPRIGAWWLGCGVLPISLVAVISIARLPLAYDIGFRREHVWGFSAQSRWAWGVDFFRNFLLSAAFSAVPIWALAALVHWSPRWWVAVAAPGAATLVVVFGVLAPLVMEPLFNRFTPLADSELANRLRSLAERTGTPISNVLVADASKRSGKVNAYVSGVGPTRRLVLYDTLLAKADAAEVELVVAHELGHRRARHVAKGTALAAAGAALKTLVIWVAVDNPGDPASVPVIMLLGFALELVALPWQTALSRQWEREADRASLDLTGRPDVFRTAHIRLAEANLSDLNPPRWLYRLLFTHPTPPERLAAGAAWRSSS